jgi:hypothetical protein
MYFRSKQCDTIAVLTESQKLHMYCDICSYEITININDIFLNNNTTKTATITTAININL